jgi:methionyl-tRNA formyltransferase
VRIVVNGQQAFGKAVLEKLLALGEEVIAVYGPADKEGRPPDPLVAFAREKGLPLHQPKSFKEPAEWDAFRALRPELCVMAYVTLFVPSQILNIPAKGTIQYHPSLLPRHRGPSSINWPIIQGETKTGLTVFWPDDGLDTGPILLQKETPIGPDDTLGSVYFDRLLPMGVEAMIEAVELVRDGKAPRIVQDETQATYESWCRADNVGIDWSKPAKTIHDLIRGSDPQPGAWTIFKGGRLQLFASKQASSAGRAAPGEVIAIDDSGMTVAAADGAIRVGRVRAERGEKVAAAKFAADSGLAKGTKLG